MKIILTSDWHIQKGVYVSIVLDFLDELWEFYKREKCEYIYILGDIFNKSSNIKNEAFIPLFLKLFKMREDGVKFVFLVGNHDIYNVSRDSLVETFLPMGEVIKKPTEKTVDGKDFFFLPYTKSEKDIPPTGDFMFTHIPIADFTFDNAFHATEKHAFKRDTFSGWKQVFTGHFHRHQEYKNICYMGSPFQLNLGERGQEKGFVVFDTVKENYEFIKYTNAPQFVKLTEENIMNIKTIDFENKFVILEFTKKVKNYAKLKHVLFEKGAISVERRLIKAEKKETEVEEIKVTKDISKIVEKSVIENSPKELKTEILLEILEGVI
jgi:DNA repair exonuclease SbcCD nuclease subunit